MDNFLKTDQLNSLLLLHCLPAWLKELYRFWHITFSLPLCLLPQLQKLLVELWFVEVQKVKWNLASLAFKKRWQRIMDLKYFLSLKQ